MGFLRKLFQAAVGRPEPGEPRQLCLDLGDETHQAGSLGKGSSANTIESVPVLDLIRCRTNQDIYELLQRAAGLKE